MKTMLKGLLFAGGVMLASALIPTSEANACVSIVPTNYGSAVYNGCGYRIMGNYRSSDGNWGGYGPIGPGRQEGISMRRGSAWGISYCNYDHWVQGSCRPKSPNQISY